MRSFTQPRVQLLPFISVTSIPNLVVVRRAVEDGRRLLHQVDGRLLRGCRGRRSRGRREVVVGGRGERRQRGCGGGIAPRHRGEAVALSAAETGVPVATHDVGVIVLKMFVKSGFSSM